MQITDFKSKAEEIKILIDQSRNILLHLHPSPDPDSAGSVLAMAEYCESLGKSVTVIAGDSDLSQTMSVLPNFEKIIPKSYGEIETGDYDLFLSIDAAAVTMISKKTEVVFPEGMTVVNIDHHGSNTMYGQVNFIDKSVPAAAELVYELVASWGGEVTSGMAENLFSGLHADTGGFRYQNTTARTLEIAAALFAVNPLANKSILEMGRLFPKGLIAYKALALSAVEEIAGDKGAVIALSFADLEKSGIKFSDTEAASLANELISVKDWAVGVTMIEKEQGRVRVSLRSKDPAVDVSKIAAVFGGGGHPMAAGILMLESIEEAKIKVVGEIKKYF